MIRMSKKMMKKTKHQEEVFIMNEMIKKTANTLKTINNSNNKVNW